MTWNAESDQRTDTIDITGTISNRVASQSNASKTRRIRDQFSSSNGNTYGDIEFPEVAPLVFPALDKLADETGKEAAGKREKLKKAKNFASEYFDRRAVAKYVSIFPASNSITYLTLLFRRARIQTVYSQRRQERSRLSPRAMLIQTTPHQTGT